MGGISVVIPCYKTHPEFIHYVSNLIHFFKNANYEFEVICVLDGPNSISENIERELSFNAEVKVVKLRKNFGQHAALLAGIHEAKGNWILTVDDDGQHPVSEIFKLLRYVSNFDLVYGIPTSRHQKKLKFASSFVNRVIIRKLLGFDSKYTISAFRLFRKELILSSQNEVFSDYILDVDLLWATSRITNVEVELVPRAVGQSTYTFKKLVQLAIPLWMGFSRIPLRIFTFIGGIGLIVNILLFSYLTVIKLAGNLKVSGFYTLASLLLLSSSILITGVGILGEYLVHIYEVQRRKPTYRKV